MRIEDYIETTVVKAAEKDGWLVRKLQWVSKRGAPDRFFAKAGRVVLIEFKSPGEAPRPDQEAEIRKLRRQGVEVHIVDTVSGGLDALGIGA